MHKLTHGAFNAGAKGCKGAKVAERAGSRKVTRSDKPAPPNSDGLQPTSDGLQPNILYVFIIETFPFPVKFSSIPKSQVAVKTFQLW